MKIRDCYTRFVLPCLFITVLIFSIPHLVISAQPGLHVVDWNAFTWTYDSASPTTDLDHSVRVIDYDGITYDGSSHTVTVTYPDSSIHSLWFDWKVNDHTAYYSLWDDIPNQPIDPGTYTGNYVYCVTDDDGEWSEMTDYLEVDTLMPPDETKFFPGYGAPQSIIAHFDDVCVNGVIYDNFQSGFDPGKWESQPAEATYVSGEVRFERTWDPESRSVGMKLVDPETINELKVTVRVESISGKHPYARIGGTFCHDSIGKITARLGIRGNEAIYVVYQEYSEGSHSITNSLVPMVSLGTVTQGNNYELTLDWDEPSATLTFRVFGINDSVDYPATYTVSGPISPADKPQRFIGLSSWLSFDTTTPTFDWDEVTGANHYRVSIYTENNTRIYKDYTKAPPYTLPPGILKPNGIYKYRIYAQKEHQWFEADNVGASDQNKAYFIAGPDEAQDPYVDLYIYGVNTWTRTPPIETLTNFSIKVHDAQGVPENIESVKVLFPDLSTQMNLYLDRNDSETCGRYRAHYFGPIQSGPYKFTVVDKDGNNHSKTEEDFISKPIGFPPETSLVPANNTPIGDTEVSFNWDDVPTSPDDPGPAFYELAFYDEDLNYLFDVKTTQSEYTLPSGILEEESLYRYQIKTRREFYEDNQDNDSLVPAYTWDSNTFFTTKTYGTALPSMNLDSFGVTVWQAPHPATGLAVCQLEFMAMVTDDDGVPENIEKVEVTYPDGITTRLLKYVDNPDWGSNYQAVEYYTDPFSTETGIQTGIYTFRVVDFDGGDGHEITLQDTLTDVVSNILPWPTNVMPANDTVLNNTMPTISWDTVIGASYYKVRFLEGWAGSTVHWSEELIQTQTSYTVPNGVLEPETTYGYRVYAYRVLSGIEVDFYSSNCLWHPVNNHFTTGEACACDLNYDGCCDMQDWLLFGQDWGRTDCNEPETEECECDLNGDGKCDMQDWLLFGEDWGRTDCPIYP